MLLQEVNKKVVFQSHKKQELALTMVTPNNFNQINRLMVILQVNLQTIVNPEEIKRKKLRRIKLKTFTPIFWIKRRRTKLRHQSKHRERVAQLHLQLTQRNHDKVFAKRFVKICLWYALRPIESAKYTVFIIIKYYK